MTGNANDHGEIPGGRRTAGVRFRCLTARRRPRPSLGTGHTFTYPKTSRDASREIQRLKTVRPTSRIELELERVDVAAEQAAREANCDVPVDVREIEGYGSTATWSRRS
jgi:hypothetical protein